MVRARKSVEGPQQSGQERREEAGQANQDQQGAPVVEQTPQPDTVHFIAQPDVLNAPTADVDSYDDGRRCPTEE
ncbi:hypothetical protein [Streptomyces sp. CBMA29]|uniref:hypothetical protein n=1 Tax=Streptomyces sp. CBMA29 TaxID=1896314 RepID=UPI0016619211|nr:hypothetical protein [Streptomyces sp. CBMA29]MBD0734115.1 hypothetical protein [Streptomyces sp. CBMA29]